MRTTALLISALVLAAAAAAATAPQDDAAQPTACADELAGWFFPPPGESLEHQQRRPAQTVGLKPQVVARLRGACPGARWALWRHGYLVHVEGDFNQVSEVKSLRKTWHALTVGAAIGQGKIPSFDQKLSVWNNDLRGQHAEATWWHVMTQTSALDYPYGDFPAYRPGGIFTYSDKNPHQLTNALARVYGKRDYSDNYADVVREAYFDAIGLGGWRTSVREDGIRFHFDLEDMGRLGLLVLARGCWNGRQVIPRRFVEELETKQTRNMPANYDGPDDGRVPHLDSERFPEAPYGFMTWTNSDGDFFPGADRGWAWASGAGGHCTLWNHRHGIVFAGVNIEQVPSREGVPQIIEAHVGGPNPLVTAVRE